jgi:hypothetical protein
VRSVCFSRRAGISDELLVHLSPLGWEHSNLTGDYIWHANMSCFSLLLLRVTMAIASCGNIGNSRIELTAKHPFCSSRLDGPIA